MPTPPKQPHAWVTIDAATRPALVIEWERVQDSNGYWEWWADLIAIVDGEPVRRKVAGRWVARA